MAKLSYIFMLLSAITFIGVAVLYIFQYLSYPVRSSVNSFADFSSATKPQELAANPRLMTLNMLPSVQGTYLLENKIVELYCGAVECAMRQIFQINDSSLTAQMFNGAQSFDVVNSANLVSLNGQLNFTIEDYRNVPRNYIPRTLVAVSTCNMLSSTVASLDSLKKSIGHNKNIDILVIDDHSTDGTVSYLTKKGFHVISSAHAIGLTQRWNFAYQYASTMNYAHLIFANNDIIVPPGALDVIIRELKASAIVVPSTTLKGAGHNPSQSFQLIHKLKNETNDYINNPVNVMYIQRSLQTRADCAPSLSGTQASSLPSMWNNRTKYNGFFFGVNMADIRPAAFQHPEFLFDNKSVMVGQEDLLIKFIVTNNYTKLMPKIAKCAFVYHHKSVTVGKSAYVIGSEAKLGRDVREKIDFYHPELSGPVVEKLTFPELYKSYDDLVVPDFKLHEHLPSSREHCPETKTVRIGMFVSDAVKTPAAGDVFTAMELAHALTSSFSNVVVTLVPRGPSWYNATILSKLDVGIALLDAFDVGKALAATQCTTFLGQVKACHATNPNIIMIAWMRNWFDRWLLQPGIGNYDLLLVSSVEAKRYFEEYPLPFAVKCSQNCLRWSQDGQSVSNKRMKVPVAIMQLATNTDKFRPGRPLPRLQSDYVFTGSYHKQYRRIMELQPELLPAFNGLIVGANWHTANVSAAWMNITIGALPYSAMPQVYRSTDIVIDDANHVTEPWGSVNSRVFDAIAAGALVITNGKLGSESTFDSKLPTYTTAEELHSKLAYYLTNKKERRELQLQLREMVLSQHSYTHRAVELQQHLNRMGVRLVDINETNSRQEKNGLKTTVSPSSLLPETPLAHIFKSSTTTTAVIAAPFALSSNISSSSDAVCSSRHSRDVLQSSGGICVGVRTFKRHALRIESLLRSLVMSVVESRLPNKPTLDMFIADTEESPSFLALVLSIIDSIYKSIDNNPMVQLHALSSGHVYQSEKNPFYGYDTTDELMQYMAVQPQCDWIMLTNGDNIYNSAWYETVAVPTQNSTVNMIAWDFVTHHKRQGLSEQHIKASMKRGFVDLGSVLVRSSVYRMARVEFLPDSVFTLDLFARDFYAIQEMLKRIQFRSIRFLRKILMFHQ